MNKKILTVGQDKGDLTGSSNLVIQAAIDYLSYIGGGTLNIGSGVYEIQSAIHLRPNISIIGGRETILRKCDNVVSNLALDGDMNQRQLTLVNADGFEPGHTVNVGIKDKSLGFHNTTAVITGKYGNTLSIDRGLNNDFIAAKGAVAERNFSIFSGYHCENIVIKNIKINGNKENNSRVGGCRNGGIYFFESNNILIENCEISDYNGDGISYQVCNDVTVRNCKVTGCGGLGLHPGSGSTRTKILNSVSNYNNLDGIFVCWRVTDSEIENCECIGNGRHGFSIGHKDAHNTIRNNIFSGNMECGMFFRHESELQGGNYNIVVNNIVLDNGITNHDKDANPTAITLGENTIGCKFIGNKIGYENLPVEFHASGRKTIGVHINASAFENVFENNRFVGCSVETVKGETAAEH